MVRSAEETYHHHHLHYVVLLRVFGIQILFLVTQSSAFNLGSHEEDRPLLHNCREWLLVRCPKSITWKQMYTLRGGDRDTERDPPRRRKF